MAEQKNLTFLLESEYYGIPILKVKEIIGMMEITRIPRMPNFIRGVINLRGKIIPVMDLRAKFGLKQEGYKERTCIIVIEIETDGVIRQHGLVVDSVSEVLKLDDTEIEPPLKYGESGEANFLTGIGKAKDKVIMLLDVDKIFTSIELDVMSKINETM
ncbi:MAG: cheW1 [Herbinix sp.]|nr:cheW1 [Herbinix sp.]